MLGVRILRDGTAAVIEHDCDPMLRVRIELGALAHTLTDREILERHHQHVLGLGAAMVATPQLRWDEANERWRPRGRALVVLIDGPIAIVDDLELTISELAGVLASHGAHICLVFLDE